MNGKATKGFFRRNILKFLAAVFVYFAGWLSSVHWHETLIRVSTAIRAAAAAPSDPVPLPPTTSANIASTRTAAVAQTPAVTHVAMSPVKSVSFSPATGNAVSTPSYSMTTQPVSWDEKIQLLNMTFVRISAGSVTLGPRPEEQQYSTLASTESPRFVFVQDDFWMMTTEFTQESYEHLMGSNPSAVRGNELPVTNVSVREVLDVINALEQLCPECRFQLPTCDESEFAARLGAFAECPFPVPAEDSPSYVTALQKFENGDVDFLRRFIGQYAWFNEAGACPVAAHKPNGVGIYDLGGNVWEWCRPDHFSSDSYWPIRGGGCSSTTVWGVSSAVRDVEHHEARRESIGFRLILEPRN